MRTQSVHPVLRRKQFEWILLGVVFALMGIAFANLHVTEVNRVNATERDRLHVMTNVVANDTEGNLKTLNLSLEGVIHDYLVGPRAIRSAPGLSLRLHALAAAFPGIRAFLVLDTNGFVTTTSDPALLGMDLSHRDYFTVT